MAAWDNPYMRTAVIDELEGAAGGGPPVNKKLPNTQPTPMAPIETTMPPTPSTSGKTLGGGGGGTGTTSPTWDTDGYAAPQYTAPRAGAIPQGYDAANWANPDMQTPKYAVGRIMSQYDPNDPAAVELAVREIQQAYPGATWNGKDLLTIPGVGTIDIIAGAGAPGASWWWGAQDGTEGQGTAAGSPGRAGMTAKLDSMLSNPNVQQDINSAIAKLMEGGFNRQSILQQLAEFTGGGGGKVEPPDPRQARQT